MPVRLSRERRVRYMCVPRVSSRDVPLSRTFVITRDIIRRLRQDKGGGAWCPKDLVTKEGKEYLEVNLHTPRLLTSTRTQGRFGNGHGVEYTEEYFVEYWRPGFNKWVRWRNRRGIEVGTIWLPHRSNRVRDFFPGSRKPELTAHQQIRLGDSSNFSISDYTREYT